MSEDLIFIPLLILGAAWSWWDGSDKAGVLPTLVRLAIAGVIASVAIWSASIPLLPAAVCVVVALLNIHLGYTKWESWSRMIPRFSVPSLIVFLLTGSWIYVLGCLIAGALYVPFHKHIVLEQVARAFKGAAIIGGLALTSYISISPIIILGN